MHHFLLNSLEEYHSTRRQVQLHNSILKWTMWCNRVRHLNQTEQWRFYQKDQHPHMVVEVRNRSLRVPRMRMWRRYTRWWLSTMVWSKLRWDWIVDSRVKTPVFRVKKPIPRSTLILNFHLMNSWRDRRKMVLLRFLNGFRSSWIRKWN